MKYPRTANYIYGNLWAVDKAWAQSVMPYVTASLEAGLQPAQPEAEREKAEPMEQPDGLGYIFAAGVIGKYSAGGMSESVIDLAQLDAQLKAFAASNLSTCVLHLDSPGGTVHGVSQTAKLIESIRETGKMIYGYTDTMACSAAQWIMAACSLSFADPFADVGSVGVYTIIPDFSEQEAKDGRKYRLVADGKYKGMGHPCIPMTDEQVALIEQRVQEASTIFKAEMDRMRGGVNPDAMQGQALRGVAALEANLIDFIADSIEDVFEYAKQNG
jgi:ClpP class serine protease